MMGMALQLMDHRNAGERMLDDQKRYFDAINRYAKKHNMVRPDGWAVGCGGFGCVWKTTNPQIVIKATTDKEEVAVARMLREEGPGRRPEGIVAYYHEGKALGTTLLWREAADAVGGLPDDLVDEINFYQPYASYVREAFGELTGSQQKRWKQEVDEAILALKDVKVTLPTNPNTDTETRIVIDNINYNINFWHPEGVKAEKMFPYRFVVAWKAARLGAKRLQSVPALRLVGEAALWAMSKGFVLADVRYANLGRVWRGGQDVWVIVDPGFTLSAKDSLPKGRREMLENPARGPQAWKMTLKEFLGDSKVVKMGQAAQLRPRMTKGAQSSPAEPFMQGLHIHRDRQDVSGYFHDVVTDEQDKEPVATYDGRNLVVAKPYRHRGIGLELVVDFRTRHPDIPAAETRNKASHALQKKAHRVIVERAVAAGMPVPERVLKDYLDLRRGSARHNPTEAVSDEQIQSWMKEFESRVAVFAAEEQKAKDALSIFTVYWMGSQTGNKEDMEQAEQALLHGQMYYDIRVSCMSLLKRSYALFPYAWKMFMALLQQRCLPPGVRRKVEAAVRSWSKTKIVIKAKQKGQIWMIEAEARAYLNKVEEIRDQIQTAKVAYDAPVQCAGSEAASGLRMEAGPFTIVNSGGFSEAFMLGSAEAMGQASVLLKSKGLGFVCYGEAHMTARLDKATVVAQYIRGTDTFLVRGFKKGNHEYVGFIIHELGHRLFDKFMSDTAKKMVEKMYRTARSHRFGQRYSSEDISKYLPKIGDEYVEGRKTFTVAEVRPDKIQLKLKGYEDEKISFSISTDGWAENQRVRAGVVPDQGFVNKYAGTDPEENFCEMLRFWCAGKLPQAQLDVFMPVIEEAIASRPIAWERSATR